MNSRRPLAAALTVVSAPRVSLGALSLVGLASVVSLATVAAGCGGEPPGAASPAIVKSTAPPPAPPTDVTAVPEPSSLVLYARIAKPSATMSVVAGWLRTQLPGVPEPGSDVVSELIAGESVGDVVDMDQPIDVAGAVTVQMPKPLAAIAISAALKDVAKAKAVFSSGSLKLVPGENGMLRIEGLGPPRDEEDGDMDARSCALAPSYGASSMRLVCGFGVDPLKTLAPYLARTATRIASHSDLHVELRLAPVHAFVTENRKMAPFLVGAMLGGGPKSPALQDIALALVNEAADLSLDIETLALDAKLGAGAAEATLTTKYIGASSMVARVVTSHADRVDVPPPAFMRLPLDAEIALFHRGFDEKELDHPRELVTNMLTEQLAKDGLTSADAKPLVDALSKAASTSPMVYASGIDAPALEKALGAAKDRAKGTTTEQAQTELAAKHALVGWRILGLDEPPARMTAAAKELAAAWNRPGVAKWAKGQDKETTPPTFKLAPLAKSSGLPKESVHLEVTVTPATDAPEPIIPDRATGGGKKPGVVKAPPSKPLRFHAFVVPDGARVWIAFGASEELVAARARTVLAGAPDAGTLLKREGLESVRDARINAGGFFTLEGALMGAVSAKGMDHFSVTRAANSFAAATSGPGKGMTPLPLLITLKPPPSGGAGATQVMTVRLPQTAIEDLLKVGMRGGFRM